MLPGLGRKVYFKVGLRKATVLRSRRLALKFCLARQIINYTVLQCFQFSWPGPAVEVIGQFCTFQQCCGFTSQQKYLNSVQVSDWILSLAFPQSAQDDKQARLEDSLHFFPPSSLKACQLSCVLSLQSLWDWVSGVKRVQDHTESDFTLDG